jgi:hypothetical protein
MSLRELKYLATLVQCRKLKDHRQIVLAQLNPIIVLQINFAEALSVQQLHQVAVPFGYTHAMGNAD